MPQASSRITVSGLRKEFRPGDEVVAALRDVTFSVAEGEIFTLLGPSGCGKTTTLRAIAGLERPDSGEIAIGEEVVFSSARRVHLPPERRPIGMVFQSYAIWPHLTVAKNVAYPLEARGVARDEVARRTAAALELVGLSGLGDRSAPLLSGGQQQRVALARALVANPSVLLLDEPLSNLDAALREQVRGEIRALQRRLGLTAVYVTHDQEEALSLSDRIAVMRGGTILEVGAPLELYQRPRSRYTAQIMGMANLIAGEVASAASPGAVAVDTAIGLLRGESSRALARGERVTVLLRPEDVRVGAAGLNTFRAKVVDVAFLGKLVDCRLALGGETVRALLHPGALGAGADLEITIDPARCWVVAEEGPNEEREARRVGTP